MCDGVWTRERGIGGSVACAASRGRGSKRDRSGQGRMIGRTANLGGRERVEDVEDARWSQLQGAAK